MADHDKPLYVKMKVVPVLIAEELGGFVLDNIEPNTCIVTDAYSGYKVIAELGYRHEAKVYAKEPPEFLKWLHTIYLKR